MIKSYHLPSRKFPLAWTVNLQDYPTVNDCLDRLIVNHTPATLYATNINPLKKEVAELVDQIHKLLADENCGIALIDLSHDLSDKPELVDRAKLLILAVGQRFGQTVTRNHLSASPFFPVYRRPEGKGEGYVGNALSNNRPGLHTDGSAWPEARVDLLALLGIREAFIGGETILVNALRVYDALPADVQQYLSERKFIRQDPYNPDNSNPVRRTVYHSVAAPFYEGLAIKYHRMFIENGHKLKNEPLRHEDNRMLDLFEKFLNLPPLRLRFRLHSGQILLVNNNIICHDRTTFLDFGRRRRHLERYWSGEVYSEVQAVA